MTREEQAERDLVPCVPFVPFACPWCNANKPRTTGQSGRKRYHRCQSCGRPYSSWQLEAADVPNWDHRAPRED